MESVKIKVTRRNGETIVKSDKGSEFKFGGKMLPETVIASLVFQTVYVNFEKLRDVSEKFEINLTMDYTVHQAETQVNFLRLTIKQGGWYKCVKDVMDNKCEVRLFTKDEYYLCPKDGMLVTDNNKTMQWQEWHHPENCFIEDVRVLR